MKLDEIVSTGNSVRGLVVRLFRDDSRVALEVPHRYTTYGCLLGWAERLDSEAIIKLVMHGPNVLTKSDFRDKVGTESGRLSSYREVNVL